MTVHFSPLTPLAFQCHSDSPIRAPMLRVLGRFLPLFFRRYCANASRRIAPDSYGTRVPNPPLNPNCVVEIPKFWRFSPAPAVKYGPCLLLSNPHNRFTSGLNMYDDFDDNVSVSTPPLLSYANTRRASTLSLSPERNPARKSTG